MMKTCFLLIGMVILLAGSSYAEIDLETLVGLWLFDEGEGDVAKDSSANDLKSELVGDLKWVEGKFGSALEFGASADDWVKIAHDEKLNLETWSVLGWVKMPDLINTSGAIIARNGDGANRSYVVVVRQAGHANAGRIHHAFRNGAGVQSTIDSNTSVVDGEWHHVAATYDQKFSRIYIDGVFDAEAQYSEVPASNSRATAIGGGPENIPAGHRLVGAIDEAAIFSVALEEDDIAEIVANGFKAVLAVEPGAKLTTTWAQIKN